ncbi:Helix-turn-helix domain-containing protein [Haloechinothrix alba]|uniref:Helix-turn-helix domain-containing protein n=1 Tax=Haloechinothrix alba TaxID=664784 RepID=A0A238WUS3_9PSEU|nr:helix-turn-helix transcriptional regulator [Haloechinothrix alba]SNR50138.1 Helix-turn-helix domain-containing protein [Haloechinothrix alba]
MTETNLAPRAFALGAELRDAREKAGLKVRQVAEKLDVSHSVIVRWEKGQRLPGTENVSALLAVLGVSSRERERIIALAREADDEPVNSVSVGVAGMADQLAVLMQLERNATSITDVSPLLVPGLLQTSAYARAILGDDAEAAARVAVRLGRRDVIERDRDPAQYLAFIGERALAGPVGDDALADQLRFLVRMSERDNVCIRIIPESAGFTPAHAGPFVLLEFAKADSVVHLEHYQSSAFLRDHGDVSAYLSAREEIEEVAMSPEDSVELIADAAKER